MSRETECIQCYRLLKVSTKGYLECPICTKDFFQKPPKLSMINVKEKYCNIYSNLIRLRDSMEKLEKSKERTKYKDIANEGISGISKLIEYMEDFES